LDKGVGVVNKQSGSALVGAVAFSVVISLFVISYITVSIINTSNGFDALERKEAFLASESGIALTASWLKQNEIFPDHGESDVVLDMVEIGGYYVYSSYSSVVDGSFVYVQIESETYNSSERNSDTFVVRVKDTYRRKTLLSYGTIIDGPINQGWDGFAGGKNFYGDFHMNSKIRLFNEFVTFHGRATTSDNRETNMWNGVVDYTPEDDEIPLSYAKGLRLKRGGDSFSDDRGWHVLELGLLDDVFTNGYGYQEEIDLGNDVVGNNSIVSNLISSSNIVLPTPNLEDKGVDYDDYRPTLEFKNGYAEYTYYNSEDGEVQTYIITDYNNKIIRTTVNLNVLGVVNGNVTLVSDMGKDVVVVGDLTYRSYINKEVSEGSTDAMAIVSGNNITFVNKWKKTPNGTPQIIDGGDGVLDVTSSLISIVGGGSKTNPIGVQYFNNAKLRTDRPNDGYAQEGEKYYYTGRFVGNNIMSSWFSTASGKVTRNGDFTKGVHQIDYIYDGRFQEGIVPVGIPRIKDVDGHWLIERTNQWVEEYSY
jgi:hypothetical protein